MPRTEEHGCVDIRQMWPEGAWPCFSPDGRQLVFSGHLDEPHTRLLLLSATGGGSARPLTPPDVNAKRPTWLSNGREIAFNRGQDSIWTYDLETGRLEPFLPQAPPNAPAYLHPCAYPGERAVVVVAFCESAHGREGVLYKLAPHTDHPIRQLTQFADVCAGRPGVSPNGEQVVFAGNAGRFHQAANQLWVVAPNCPPRRLETGAAPRCQGRAPRWSPDGKWIACTSTRPDEHPVEDTPKAIWIISAAGDGAYRLTDRSFAAQHVAWSPDQRLLACGGGGGLGLLELPDRFRFAAPAGRESKQG